MVRLYLTILICTFMVSGLSAQFNENQGAADRLYARAMELYSGGKHGPARVLFEEYEQKYPEGTDRFQVAFLKVMAALMASHADSESLASSYLANNQSFNGEVSKGLGLFYFNNKDYAKSAQYFQKSTAKGADDELLFKMGYAYYKNGNEIEALSALKRLTGANSRYATEANYYAGFIHFNQGEYSQALPLLNRASQDEAYASKVKPLLADIYFKQGNDKMLADIAATTKDNDPNAAQIYILAGEMYYLKKDYRQAIQFFEKGNKKVGSKDAGLNYKLGVAYESQGQPAKAIESYKLAATGKDSTAHYATYQLGKLYTNEGNLNFAASTFYTASRMENVPNVRRDALLQLGKVNFAAGKFKEAIDAFTEFTTKFPNAEGTSEANELISKAFLQSSNYDQAISYIEKIPNKSQMIKATYQRVCFLKGTQLFNQSQFFQAVQFFNKSLENPIDKELVASANFWKGEAFSVGKQYDDAIKAYTLAVGRDTRSSYGHRSQYGIAYAHYNAKRYRDALPFFQRYLNNDGGNAMTKEMKVDAILRLADCFFAEKQYESAISTYQSVMGIDDKQIDYALFQTGMAYQLSNRGQEAQSQYNSIISRFPQSLYRDDAFFQSAQVDFEAGNYRMAITKFTELIANFPTSNFTPYAYLRRALSYNNIGEFQKTEQDYIKLISDFPTHPNANSAILGLQEVMSANGRSADFDEYLTAYKKANPESTNLETLDFEAAKSQYFAQNYSVAIARLLAFIQKYSKSQFIEEANFYLADAYFRQGNNAKSLEAYQIILANPRSVYYLRSVARVANLEFTQKQFANAIRYFHVLRAQARSNRDRTDAFLGLMESHFNLTRFDSTAIYANQILELGGSSFSAQGKAHLFLGKAALSQKKYDDAMDHFINTLNIAKDETGAEAQYSMAFIHFERKNHRQSINTLYELNNSFGQYDFWLGKSFLLIADNFVALNEMLQAEATLNSLIEKSPNEAIKQEARAKKAQLSNQVSKDTKN